MRKTLILLCTFFCAIITAQDITVSGTVFDVESNELLPGASVVVSGSNVGTTTDFDGKFTLENLSINDQLVVSYLGYDDYTTSIDGSTNISVGLNLSSSELEEVVVICYGTQTK